MTLERGTLRGSGGNVAGCRSRQAACRHASSQKRRRPCGVKLAPQNPHMRVVARPLSLRNGVLVIPTPSALPLRQRPFEPVRFRARLDDVGAVGDAIQYRFAQPSVSEPVMMPVSSIGWYVAFELVALGSDQFRAQAS
jgi:hypothetical protein